MPARRSKTNQSRKQLRTCNERHTNGGGSRRRVCFSFGSRRKSESGGCRCLLFQTSRTPWVSGPPKDGQPMMTKARELSRVRLVSRPPQDGRPGTTIRAWTATRNADSLTTLLGATRPGKEREPRTTISEQAAFRSTRTAKFVLRGSNVRHERRRPAGEAGWTTSARWSG